MEKKFLAHHVLSALHIWRTDIPCAITIGGPMVSHLIGLVRTKEIKKADQTVRRASPIFTPIAYKLRFTNRKQKYVVEKTTSTLKIKQTSIATVRNHILTVACFLTPSLFITHYL
jgi:hypothetical protein